MLPLVLGGIALATVGYGVKKYCEADGKGCDALTDGLLNFSDSMENFEQKMMGNDNYEVEMSANDFFQNFTPLGRLSDFREQIYKDSIKPFLELQENFQGFESTPIVCEEILPIKSAKIKLNAKEEICIEHYKHTLGYAQNKLTALLPKFQLIVTAQANVTTFDATQRQSLKKVYVYASVLAKLLTAKVVNKDGEISKKLDLKVLMATKRMIEVETA